MNIDKILIMRRLIITVLVVLFPFLSNSQDTDSLRIRPFLENPFFWQYKNQPVLLIGGSNFNNFFQQTNQRETIDDLAQSGVNYLCNTIGSLEEGNVWPFWRAGEKYNLDKFNNEFWNRFDNFLKYAYEKNMIIQMEIWPINDLTEMWDISPWNPANHQIISDGDESFPDSLMAFFQSIPELLNNTLLLSYQQAYINQILTYSLNYNNIIYCISSASNNAIPEEWGKYWSTYIMNKANQQNMEIEITGINFLKTIENVGNSGDSSYFTYLDLSYDSIIDNQAHWQILQSIRTKLDSNPCPVNHMKIYGGIYGEWTGGPMHGIETFWRDLIGGAASVRFNKYPYGLGYSERAINHIKSARMIENEYNFFNSIPDINFSLLLEREKDEAYLATNKDNDIIIYFTDGGQVILDFTDYSGNYYLKWLNIEGGNWYKESSIEGGGIIEIKTPFPGAWIALLKKANN